MPISEILDRLNRVGIIKIEKIPGGWEITETYGSKTQFLENENEQNAARKD